MDSLPGERSTRMTERLFDYLASFGFKKFGGDIAELVDGMSKKQLISFAQGADAVTVYATNRVKSPYEFSASNTFAGAPTPCSSFECRLDRVRELAYFAALYADRVLIASPFPGIDRTSSIVSLQTEIVTAVASCLYLKPLLVAGIVEYIHRDQENVCVSCYAGLSGKTAEQGRRIISDLEREYTDRVKYYLERENGVNLVVPEGPSDLFDVHTVKELKSIPISMRKIVRGDGRWLIPTPVATEMKLPREYALPAAFDIFGRDMCADRFGTSYLTRREIDLRVVNDAMSDKRNDRLNWNLGHDLPLLFQAAPSDLINLRRNETDAFKTYQVALQYAAAKASSEGPVNVSQLFQDVIAPEIRRMNAALKSARSSLKRGLAADVASASAFVSIALMSGLIAPGLATAITAAGGIHFTSKVALKVSKLIKQEPRNARQDQFYFLWKVANLARP
jgi:hypothetical protein